MKPVSRFFFLVALFATLSLLVKVHIWFFDDVWNSDLALQYKELVLLIGAVMILYGAYLLTDILRNKAWKTLSSQNAVPFMAKNLLLNTSFWFGLWICARTIPFFLR
jgi:hypothetical protein